MSNTEYKAALHEQLRDPHAYLDQAENLLFGLSRLLGWWVVITVTYTSAAVLFALITLDLSAHSQADLQEALRVIVAFASGISAFACLIGGAGRFQNIFTERAWDAAEQSEAITDKIEFQIKVTERLLVRHGLITQADVERRRAAKASDTTPIR